MLAAGFDLRLFTSLTDCHESGTLPIYLAAFKKKKRKKGREKRKIQIFTAPTDCHEPDTVPCALRTKEKEKEKKKEKGGSKM